MKRLRDKWLTFWTLATITAGCLSGYMVYLAFFTTAPRY